VTTHIDNDIMPHGTYWATPSVLAGPHPNARSARAAELGEAGITRIIDLTAGTHVIQDFSTPTAAGMEAILDSIRGETDGGGRVYVHCLAGLGRTGTVVGCLLAELGESDPLARLAELRERAGLDGDSPETAQQRRMVREWLRRSGGGLGAAPSPHASSAPAA
jgi:hypothetical protein